VLNPDVPVVTAADRVAGALAAREQGADVAVLDDAFQHRRARREVDLVLVSADRWDGRARLLPAGPWREPLDALRRATLLVVTRKAAAADAAAAAVADLARAAPGVPAAIVHLAPGALRAVHGGAELPLAALAGARVLAVSAVGDPRAYAAQLRDAGARVEAESFPDHYPFAARDVDRLVERAARADRVVCTLKDAVKLGPLWPRAATPLWYVSQRVSVERGAPEVGRALDAVLAARSL
jgi:tetraacyldisaccharide 4'-kinase